MASPFDSSRVQFRSGLSFPFLGPSGSFTERILSAVLQERLELHGLGPSFHCLEPAGTGHGAVPVCRAVSISVCDSVCEGRCVNICATWESKAVWVFVSSRSSQPSSLGCEFRAVR